MKDITIFINTELKPRLYGYIPQIFPELHFIRKGNKYISNLHADGTEGTGHKEDRSVVTEKQPTKVFDNTRQEAKDIITLYMEHNNITEVWEAVNKLCSIVGIIPPENTPEGQERFRQAEQRRTALEASAERQKKALFAPEGKEVLEYLHSRGWTDDEIREAELGYISTDEASTINAQRSIGDFYRLSIPLRSGSVLYGFKFRTILKNTTGKDKYTYLYGTEKRTNLFNLTGIQQEDGAIVVVEGELDALHAQTRGISGIVATGGGKLTGELLDVATDRGIKRITLLFDKDERGVKFLRDSIDIAHNRGISVLVATFPDGETLSDGKAIHDIDEYLQAHTPQELQSLINNAVSGSNYLLDSLVNDAIKANGEGNLTDAAELDLRNKVIALANHTPSEIEREYILSYYANLVNIDGKQAFSEAALRAVANRERVREELEKVGEELGKTTKEVENLLQKGNVKGALKKLKEASSRMKPVEDAEKFGDLLKVPSREERLRKYKEQPEALRTSYKFTNRGEKLPFTLPSGALTILAAPTSHGKSTFLRNLAIDVAKRYKKENNSVLYFTFEESEEDVIAQFTNTYIGKKLHRETIKHTQVETIIQYFKTGKPNYIGGNDAEISREDFISAEQNFSTDYLDSGKIRIFFRDYDLETLIEALEFAVSNIPTKAIFIDYLQILRSQQTKQPRTDQLKEICISLKDFGVKYKIPVVLAAQLNREATNPLRMANTMMAESSDIEKAANTIVCLWNSKFKSKMYGEKGMSPDEKAELKELEARGLNIGKDGQIFALITKIRGSRGVGMYEIFNFNGYSGKVIENYPEDEQKADRDADLRGEEENNTLFSRWPKEDPF